MLTSPYIDIYSVITATIHSNKLSIPIQISETEERTVKTFGLIDSGAGGKFIDQNYVKKSGFKTHVHALETPIWAYNVDGTENKRGTIKSYVNLNLEINGRKTNTQLLITRLGKEQIILGFLGLTNKTQTLIGKQEDFPGDNQEGKSLLNGHQGRNRYSEEEDKDAYLNWTQNPLEDSELSLLIASITGEMNNKIWINSKSTTATQLQAEINSKKTILPLEEQIPKEFHEYLDVFSEEKAARFPKPRSWDHKIELKEGFIPKSFKTYNLTPQEQIELDKFLKENMEKGYLCKTQEVGKNNPKFHQK